MTREEAKTFLLQLNTEKIFNVSEHEAIRVAIKALSQEPCDDAISREAVLNMQYRIDDSATLSTRDVVNVEDIEDLPSVTQKSGKWHRKYDRIVNDLFWECDKCGCGYQHEYNYCPNCGAKMESEEV